jgi:hypothetical protein
MSVTIGQIMLPILAIKMENQLSVDSFFSVTLIWAAGDAWANRVLFI